MGWILLYLLFGAVSTYFYARKNPREFLDPLSSGFGGLFLILIWPVPALGLLLALVSEKAG
jgi:hypothetical protein